jgi:hypothetical protein
MFLSPMHPLASGTSHLGMIDIQATTKSKYYDHIVSGGRIYLVGEGVILVGDQQDGGRKRHLEKLPPPSELFGRPLTK